MKIENFKLKIWVICLLGYLFVGLFSQANAQEVSLRVAPSLLQIKLYPPTEINAPVTIENTGNETVVLTSELRLFKAGGEANGQTVFITGTGDKADLLRDIRLENNGETVTSLTLGAKQKRDLQLRIQIPAETPSQDLYFSVVFISEPAAADAGRPDADQTSLALLNAGIAMNVILSIGDSQPNAAVEEFSTPRFIQKGPVPFTVKIQNNGAQYINPKGSITIKNMFGQTIGKIDLTPETILADSSRYLSNSNQSSVISHQSSVPKAVWPESFLLGFYEAKLTVQPTPDAIPLTQTLRFTALPMRLAVGFILAILLGVTIYNRVKERIS